MIDNAAAAEQVVKLVRARVHVVCVFFLCSRSVCIGACVCVVPGAPCRTSSPPRRRDVPLGRGGMYESLRMLRSCVIAF